MSKTFVSIIMWSSNRFLGILCAVMMLVLSGIPLSAAEKQKSKRLEDGSLYRYPLLDGLIVGVDLFQPVVSLFGQQYANYQVSLEVSFHNRFFPIWETGIGWADNTPDDGNFTYKVSPTLYNRLGVLYNFNYNSTAPGYIYMGLLYGFSIFSYDITNIDLSSGYWGTNDKAAIYGCHSRAQWLEPLAGIRVNLYKGLKMGFSVRYKVLLKAKNDETTRPWIIPGMGKRGGGFDFTYSLYYQIPIKTKKRNAVTEK